MKGKKYICAGGKNGTDSCGVSKNNNALNKALGQIKYWTSVSNKKLKPLKKRFLHYKTKLN